jgi:hypothetical protein
MPQALVSGKKNISPNVSIFFFTRETSACGKCSNPVRQYTIIQITIRLRVLLNPIILAINYKTHY